MKTTYVAVYFEVTANQTFTQIVCEGSKSKCDNYKKKNEYVQASVEVMTKRKYENEVVFVM